ncbi:hypothetical protein [Ferroacidibacillus organovorans]|uniref:Uncharacterized protein n=1 Tax=Ferroacidibacillus organovorans TaxID=1765683 RepID=A0A101XRD1_9BACL|nr:hypothetical protein [Ferroacidibacillus organovorans]KUO96149.1 hypothetical protein ATW55_14545 [Ferroacidibacillus organovorans]
MCELARTLLAEKLIDDFYEDDLRPRNTLDAVKKEWTEELKQLLPEEKWMLLYLFESQTMEECGKELRRFADFVAKLLMDGTHVKQDGAVVADDDEG